MLPKPDGCLGCPLYGDGLGWVPGLYPEGAEVAVIGQSPGAEEEAAGVPLVGKTGKYLDEVFLPLAGLDPKDIARDNVIRCRWQIPGKKEKTNELPKDHRLVDGLRHCSQYDPDYGALGIRLIVSMGVVSLGKLAPGLKQHEWRGHLLPEV